MKRKRDRLAPGAMPFSAGSSGWWAAVMPATCVPWLPASTTAGEGGGMPVLFCQEGEHAV